MPKYITRARESLILSCTYLNVIGSYLPKRSFNTGEGSFSFTIVSRNQSKLGYFTDVLQSHIHFIYQYVVEIAAHAGLLRNT